MPSRRHSSLPLALALAAALGATAASVLAPAAAQAYSQSERYYDRQQVEQLVAPIALYPDPLLAQMLTAAAYPEEILEARRYFDGRRGYSALDRQDWDSSVRAVARYPEALDLLARDIAWTEALGIAYINQPDDVSDAIQRWRLQAWDLGNLRSDARQTVYVENGYVRIVPTQQEYVYVPSYDPRVIYFDRYQPGYPGYLLFSSGYGIGSWFDRDWDWRSRRIYYCDRRYWRNGRPVFDPHFDRVHVDRNRPWQFDRKRFKPPSRPSFPDRFGDRDKWRHPRADIKPGSYRGDGKDRNDWDRKDGDRNDWDRDERDRREPDRKSGDVRNGNDRDGDRDRSRIERDGDGKPPMPTVRRGERNVGKPDATDRRAPVAPKPTPTLQRRDDEKTIRSQPNRVEPKPKPAEIKRIEREREQPRQRVDRPTPQPQPQRAQPQRPPAPNTQEAPPVRRAAPPLRRVEEEQQGGPGRHR